MAVQPRIPLIPGQKSALNQAAIAALTDSTGGTPGATLAAIAAGGAYAQADLVAIKNAIASLNASVDLIRTALKNAGITA